MRGKRDEGKDGRGSREEGRKVTGMREKRKWDVPSLSAFQ